MHHVFSVIFHIQHLCYITLKYYTYAKKLCQILTSCVRIKLNVLPFNINAQNDMFYTDISNKN